MNMFQIIITLTAISIAVIYPLYSLVKRDKTPASWSLFAALFFSAAIELFDLLSIIRHENMLYWKKLAIFTEGCLPFSWLLFSLTFARPDEMRATPPLQRFLLALSAIFIAVPYFIPSETLFYSPDLSQELMLFLGKWGYLYYLVLMVFMIVALINLEATYSNASRGARWSIKFEILGAGTMLVALIYYYSQSLLYRIINMNLIPVRTTALIIAVIFTAFSQLWRTKEAKIQISRSLVYKSVVLLAVGLYLLVLGLVGEGMRYFGESFQHALAITIAFVAGLCFLIVLLSESMKRKIKIFLDRNLFRDKYDYRSQWLQFTTRLSSSKTGDELLIGILSGYCETFGMGCGALYLSSYTSASYSFAARLQMITPTKDFKRDEPFISQMLKNRLVVNIHEITPVFGKDDFFKANEVTFVVPIFLNDRLEGFIILGRPLNKNETYGTEDYDLMKTFACQTASAILNLRLSEQLAQAKEMEVLGKISAFVVHDLKNLVYTISLILDNARDYISEPEFQQDMLTSLDNTVAKMKTLIAKLKYLPEKKSLQKCSADLLRLVRETAATITGAAIHVSGSSVIAEIDRDEMQKVTLNLLLNAVDATDGKGPVTVEVGSDNHTYIRVKDEGCGIPEEFLRHDLFNPFKSTKKSGLGIGLFQCKQIVEAHGGCIEVDSIVGRGTVFTVLLPLAAVTNEH